MTNYKSATDDAKGSPNTEAIQYLQENWGKSEIDASVRVARTEITASGTSGVAISIPVGATILDIIATPTVTNGGGTAKVRIAGAGADISNAITFAVVDTLTHASTIDQTYAKVSATGIEVVTNGDGDLGFVDVYYKK
jgi:hypothetical protein